MNLLCAAIESSEAQWAIVLIAAWLVFVCLKTIGKDLDYAVRWRDLQVQAKRLRHQQIKRLKELGIKHGRRAG